MSDVAIRAEGLGKKYLVGHRASSEGYVTLRDTVARTAKGLVRSAQDMARGRQLVEGDEVEEFWALKDVNFEIKRGDVVGVIGRNGAGKSTLLKILSRITEPSTGRVEIKGRVASLLEVGTGFHAELTGRENIFLNGAILGMTRAEIKRKFDEIVAFADVEKFLDTPVKRYSSGMYVRLAFAVAAHLEPEILIVDEVLAVGDAEFQKKCLGKMQDVAGHGRTILFVSHNLSTVQSLCRRAFLFQRGVKVQDGDTQNAIKRYLYESVSGIGREGYIEDVPRIGAGALRFHKIRFFPNDTDIESAPVTGLPCNVVLSFTGRMVSDGIARIGITFKDALGNPLVLFASDASNSEPLRVRGEMEAVCSIDKFPLTPGKYTLSLFLEVNGVIQDWIEDSLTIEVEVGSFFGTARNCPNGWEGRAVLVDHVWGTRTASVDGSFAAE